MPSPDGHTKPLKKMHSVSLVDQMDRVSNIHTRAPNTGGKSRALVQLDNRDLKWKILLEPLGRGIQRRARIHMPPTGAFCR